MKIGFYLKVKISSPKTGLKNALFDTLVSHLVKEKLHHFPTLPYFFGGYFAKAFSTIS